MSTLLSEIKKLIDSESDLKIQVAEKDQEIQKLTGNRWMFLFQDALVNIVDDTEIPAQAKVLFMKLLTKLDFENFIHIKQKDIAQELGQQCSHISSYMKVLVNKGIILKITSGSASGYKLNPNYAWKGKISNRNKEVKNILDKRLIDLQSYKNALKPDTNETN